MFDFHKINPNVPIQAFKLPYNYRSLPAIVSVSNQFAKIADIPGKELQPQAFHQKPQGFVGKVLFTDSKQEAHYIIQAIHDLVKQSRYEYRDFGILLRSIKRNMDPFIHACQELNIPYRIAGKAGLFERLEIKAMVKFFIWLGNLCWKASDSMNNTTLEQGIEEWLQCCAHNHILNPKTRTEFTHEELHTILENWKSWSLQTIESENQAITPSQIQILSENLGQDPGDYDVELEPIIQSDPDELKPSYLEEHQPYLKGTTYVNLMTDLLYRLGVKSWDFDDLLHATVMANLGKFSTILNDFEFTHKVGGDHIPLDKYLQQLQEYLEKFENRFEEAQGMDERFINAVTISTVHQAKGLEWAAVFIPAIVQGHIPSPLMRQEPNTFLQVEGENPPLWFADSDYITTARDEARIIYVAQTRPKHFLLFSAYRKDAEGQIKEHKSIVFQQFNDPELFPDILPIDPHKSLSHYLETFDWDHLPARDPSRDLEEFTITELLDYKKCPVLYLFRHIWQFGGRLNRFIGYGKILHHILRRISEMDKDLFQNERKIHNILQELMETDFKLRFFSEEMNANIRQGAAKMLENYICKFNHDFRQMHSVETRLELVESQTILKGIADVILDDKISQNAIHVRDYKTTDLGPGMKDVYQFQIGLYAAALQKSGYHPTQGSVGFLKEAKNLQFPITKPLIKKTLQEANLITKKIKMQNFHRPEGTPSCTFEWCDYGEICPFMRNKKTYKKKWEE